MCPPIPATGQESVNRIKQPGIRDPRLLLVTGGRAVVAVALYGQVLLEESRY